MPAVKRSEPAARRPRWTVFLIAALVPLLNVIPTIDGYVQQSPPERVFLGFRTMAGDHYQYGSMVRQASDEGRFLLENRYTTEPQRPGYVLLFFWLLGVICRVTGLALPLVWELMRVAVGFGFLMAVWWFLGNLFEEERARLTAYVFVALSGGIGWLALLLPEGLLARQGFPGMTDPANFQWNWSTFSAMLVPLWIFPSMILLATASFFTQRAPLTAWKRWAAGLLAGPLIWFAHPYTGNAAYLAFGLYALAPLFSAIWRVEPVPWRKVAASIGQVFPFLVSFAVVLLYLRWARQDPVFAQNGSDLLRNWNASYSIFWYPFTYGLLVPLALFGARWSGKLPERGRHMLLGMLAAFVLLSVNPLLAGVKHQYLVHMPLSVLAAHGLLELRARSPRVRAASHGVLAFFLGAALFLNPPLFIVQEIQKTARQGDVFRSAAEVEAMRFLDSQPAGSVLCSYRSGNVIAWLSRKKAFVGHWLLTIDSRTKQRELAAFFSPRVPADQKREFLAGRGLRYVFHGPSERALGRVDPGLELQPIYNKDGVTIYRVP